MNRQEVSRWKDINYLVPPHMVEAWPTQVSPELITPRSNYWGAIALAPVTLTAT